MTELNRLEAACADGTIGKLAEDYISANTGRLPNIAGFCCSLECGIDDFNELKKRNPHLHGMLLAMFESAALNSGTSASVLTIYLKGRLGYGGDAEHKQNDGLKVVFEHDIMRDGQ